VTTGRVTIAFRHLPLGMHQYAQQAAETAACAGRQGKFWPFHNLLFQHQDKLGDAQIRDWARQAGVDEHALDRCIDHDAKGDVERDAQLANTLHVRGTPAFLIGSRNPDGTVHVVRVLSGARPVKDFQDAIESVAPVRARS
jgi:protein-disulfide isomerase